MNDAAACLTTVVQYSTTRGLIDAGGYVMAGIDKDERCEDTFVGNNVNGCIDYSSPRFLKCDVFASGEDYPQGRQEQLFDALESLIPYYRKKAPAAPLLFAICAPCQPFTKLSKKELSEKRKRCRERDSNLLREACKFVERFRPELVLSENVSGIKEEKYGGVWDDFRTRLEELGFLTGSKVVCTSRFGIPQYRHRSILVAGLRELVRSERLADVFGSEILVPEADPDALTVSVRHAIGHLPPVAAGETHPTMPNHRARSLSELNLKRLASAKPGESNAYMEDTEYGDLSLDCHRNVNNRLKQRCFSHVYTRMDPDRPSPTILRNAIAFRTAVSATTTSVSFGAFRCAKRRSYSRFPRTMYSTRKTKSSRSLV